MYQNFVFGLYQKIIKPLSPFLQMPVQTRSQSKKVQLVIKSHHETPRAYKNKCVMCWDTAKPGMKLYQTSMCKCKGSTAIYHYECLQQMLDNIVKDQDIPYECKTCRDDYNSVLSTKALIYDRILDYATWIKDIISDFYLPLVFNLIQLAVVFVQALHVATWSMHSFNDTYPVITPPVQIEWVTITHVWVMFMGEKYYDYTFMGRWATTNTAYSTSFCTGIVSLIYFVISDLLAINLWKNTTIEVVCILFMSLSRRLIPILFGVVLRSIVHIIKCRLRTEMIQTVAYSPVAKSRIVIQQTINPFRPHNYMTKEQVMRDGCIQIELDELVE